MRKLPPYFAVPNPGLFLYVFIHVFIQSRPGLPVCPSIYMTLFGGRVLMEVHYFVEFVWYFVSSFEMLTLWYLVCAVYEMSFWAIALEPKAVRIIAECVPPLSTLPHITVNEYILTLGCTKSNSWKRSDRPTRRCLAHVPFFADDIVARGVLQCTIDEESWKHTICGRCVWSIGALAHFESLHPFEHREMRQHIVCLHLSSRLSRGRLYK